MRPLPDQAGGRRGGGGLGRPAARRARPHRAVLKYAFEGEEWQEAPFALFDNDRWTGRFRPDRVGRWRYTIEAWTDRFGSWRDDVTKKRDAGQDLALELVEGEHLVRAAIRHAATADATRLRAICEELASGRYGAPGRAAAIGRIARADGARPTIAPTGCATGASWRSSSTGRRRASPPGTRCSRAARAASRARAPPSTT